MVRAYAHGVNASPMVWPLGRTKLYSSVNGRKSAITGGVRASPERAQVQKNNPDF